MPNIWLNTYNSGLDAAGTNTGNSKITYAKENSNVLGTAGSDVVYRLTFYYIYGK